MGGVWGRWFPTEPAPETLVPRQVALLMHSSLQRLKEHWESVDKATEMRAQTAATYAAMSGAAKKRRAELVDAVM